MTFERQPQFIGATVTDTLLQSKNASRVKLEDEEHELTTRRNLSSELEDYMRDDLNFKCGLYHKLLLFFLIYETVVGVFAVRFISIANLKPDAFCVLNKTESYHIDYCSAVFNASICPTGWQVEIDQSFYSLAQEWPETVCVANSTSDGARLTHTMASITIASKLIPSVLTGVIADSIGRKTSLVVGCLLRAIGGAWLVYVESWQAFTAALFIVTFGCSMTFYPHRTLVVEFFTRKYRLLPTCCSTWCLAFPIYALVSYLAGNWRTVASVHAIMNIPSLIAAILCFESPRWLVENRKFHRAAAVFNWVSGINRIPAHVTKQNLSTLFASLTPPAMNFRNSLPRICMRFVQLFKRPELRWITVTIILLRFHSSLYHTVFSLSLDQFDLNPFIIIALQGLMRIWLPFLLAYIDFRAKSYRRRLFFLASIGLSLGIAVVSTILLSLTNVYPESRAISIAAAISILTDNIAASMVWMAWTQIISEFFPTNARNTAYGFFFLCFAIGQSFGPQLVQLKVYWTPLPFFIPTLILVCAGVLAFFTIPETRSIPQIANFADLDAFPQTKPWKQHKK